MSFVVTRTRRYYNVNVITRFETTIGCPTLETGTQNQLRAKDRQEFAICVNSYEPLNAWRL